MHLSRSLLLAAVCVASLSAGDAELALVSGRTVRGEIVTDAPTGVTLRMRSPVRGGVRQAEVTYAKNDILRRNDVPSPEQQYAERKARTPDTVPELCTLAQWCYENCLREQARSNALRVLELDPESAWAKRILDNCGYIEVDSKWVDEADYMQANKLARVDGQLVPIAVAEARKVLAKAVANRERCSKLVQDLKAVLAEKPGTATANDAKAKSLTAAADASKKSLDDLDAKLTDLRQQPPARGVAAADQRRNQISDLEKRYADLQSKLNDQLKAAAEAKRLATHDKTSADQAKAKLPDAEDALAKANDEVKAAAASLPADDVAAKAALATLAAPPKPAASTAPTTEVKNKVPQTPAGGASGGKPPKDE